MQCLRNTSFMRAKMNVFAKIANQKYSYLPTAQKMAK